MKLERLSDNQIRCTLTKSDLAEKEVRISELAYGSEKAKELFRDLMQQASVELGFEADNMPLMIEAIPVSQECLILVITKVEDPDELDTRFSKFTAPAESSEEDDMFGGEDAEEEVPDEFVPLSEQAEKSRPENNKPQSIAEGILDTLRMIEETIKNKPADGVKHPKPKAEAPGDTVRVYSFGTLDKVIRAASLINRIYASDNMLYKNPQDKRFYLYLTRSKNTEAEFADVCNILAEYGQRSKYGYATVAHMEEHYTLVIDRDAVKTLAEL